MSIKVYNRILPNGKYRYKATYEGSINVTIDSERELTEEEIEFYIETFTIITLLNNEGYIIQWSEHRYNYFKNKLTVNYTEQERSPAGH